MAQYHTPEEEAALRGLDDLQLAKKNNRGISGAFVYRDEIAKAKFEEERAIVRDELFKRGYLDSADTIRLIDGRELK